MKLFTNRKRDYIEEIRSNPNVYCFNECCRQDCPKHKSKLDIRKRYLLALLKDTPYCPIEDREDYELIDE